MLTIERTVSTAGYDKLAPLYTEYNVGNYFRQFALNSEVDESRISAKMRNGVLTVDLPKHEQAKPRTINVAAG
jgi:HSP20 family protein